MTEATYQFERLVTKVLLCELDYQGGCPVSRNLPNEQKPNLCGPIPVARTLPYQLIYGPAPNILEYAT